MCASCLFQAIKCRSVIDRVAAKYLYTMERYPKTKNSKFRCTQLLISCATIIAPIDAKQSYYYVRMLCTKSTNKKNAFNLKLLNGETNYISFVNWMNSGVEFLFPNLSNKDAATISIKKSESLRNEISRVTTNRFDRRTNRSTQRNRSSRDSETIDAKITLCQGRLLKKPGCWRAI